MTSDAAQMTQHAVLLTEFAREVKTTRRLLERVPDDRLGWKPHPKSFSVGMLASHIADCLGWADAIFASDQLSIDPATYVSFAAESVAQLLQTFDDRAANCHTRLAQTPDAALMRPWRLTMLGKVRFEKPRVAVFRDFTLNHLIHHRGQLSVYLRLLDVPVPGAYGPTADERF